MTPECSHLVKSGWVGIDRQCKGDVRSYMVLGGIAKVTVSLCERHSNIFQTQHPDLCIQAMKKEKVLA